MVMIKSLLTYESAMEYLWQKPNDMTGREETDRFKSIFHKVQTLNKGANDYRMEGKVKGFLKNRKH